MRTIDIKISELCDEIDYWKDEAHHWKKEYEDLLKEHNLHVNNELITSQKNVAKALMFALHVKDNPDGSLSINKKDRKTLAKIYDKKS